MTFESKILARIAISLTGSVSDILANVVLFLPIGFLFQLTRRRTGFGSVLQALALGGLVSTALETCQLFLPGRIKEGCQIFIIEFVGEGFGDSQYFTKSACGR